MSRDYKVAGRFQRNEEELLVVRMNGNAHIMTHGEFKKWYGWVTYRTAE